MRRMVEYRKKKSLPRGRLKEEWNMKKALVLLLAMTFSWLVLRRILFSRPVCKVCVTISMQA